LAKAETETRSPGEHPDIWCNPDEELQVIATELAATEESDPKRAALLLYELGRVHLAAGNERAAAKAFLKSYTLRPRFRPTLRIARHLYHERADHRLAIKLLEGEARATRDPLSRTALLRLQARMQWSRLQDLPAACQTLEEAHRLDAADLATLKMQELLFAIDRNPDRLRSALLRQLESISDNRVRVALLVDLAMLLVGSDPKAAIDTLRSAERTAPDDLTVLCHLEQVFELEGHHRELAETIQRQVQDPQASTTWQARQLARAARIYRDHIGDPASAADLFRRSLELQPVFAVATDCFDLLLERKAWHDAVAVGEQLFELDDNPALQASLACQIADIYRIRLDDNPCAAIWYEHCLKVLPTYQPALEGLGWILESRGEVDRLLRIHRSDLESAKEPSARAQRLYRIATLLERHERESEAREVHQEALAVWPDSQPCRSALERLLVRHERWTDLLELYKDELKRSPDLERERHILETMAFVWYHQLDDADQAIECYNRILELDSTRLGTIRTLARLCFETQRWDELVKLNERELGLITEPRSQVEILQRSGEIWEDNLLNLDEAMACYQRALDIDPRHLPSLRSLGRLLRQRGRWTDLIRMHLSEIAATDDPEQIISLLYDIAEIHEDQLLDERKAANTYREILGRRPGHLPAIDALGRILKRQDDWAGLVELMELTLDAVDDNRGKALRLWRMGVIKEEQLCDAGAAINDYTRALRLAPDLAPARAALEQILEEIGDHQQLAEIFTTALEQTEQPTVRAAIAHRLGTIWEHSLKNVRRAALFYEKAALASDATWYQYSVVQAYEAQGTPRELCAALARLAARVSDERVRAEIQLRIGRITRLAALADPVPFFSAAATLPSGRSSALRAMENVLRSTHRLTAVADLLPGRIENANDPIELACLWTELAELHLRLDDRAAAEHAFGQALINSPSHLPAISGVAALLKDQQRWTELAELYENEAAVTENPRNLADALVRAAVLWEEKANDPSRAEPLYRRVLEVQQGHDQAYQRLHAILTDKDEWADLASLIRTQISVTTDPQKGAAMFVELGQLYLNRLDQRRKGEACLRRTLELDPLNVYALTTLGDIYYEAAKWKPAQRMYTRLEPLVEGAEERARLNTRLGDAEMGLDDPHAALAAFQRAHSSTGGQDPALLRKIVRAAQGAANARAQVAALERLAECSPDAGERVEVRKQMAHLAETALDNDELAVRALEEALVLDPLDIEAIERLAAVYGRASNRSAANQHLQAAVAHHRAELARRPFDLALYRQLGRIFQWQRLFDRLYCSAVVQFHLGELEEVQQRFLWTHHRRCSTVPKGPLSRSRYETLVLPEYAKGPVRDLLSSAGLGLQKRAAIDPSSLGVDKSSKVKSNDPLRGVCDEVASLLGGVDFDLAVSRTQPDLITAEMLARPTLVLGERVARNMVTAVERFRIGRALFLITENALVLRDLSVRDINHLLAGLGKAAVPTVELPLSVRQPEQVEKEHRTLTKLLARRDRKLLGQLLPNIAPQLETANLADFARSLGFGANRAGLVAAGDPKVALEEATQLTGSPDSGPEMADLLQYMLSEEYFTIRLELGIAPGSG
jgi:tetratricopeptide (TPR) repeat protein